MKHEKVTTSAKRILRRRLYDGKPQRIAEREQTRREMCLGMKIQRRREEAGLTQKQLADRIGTQPSAIVEFDLYHRPSILLGANE